MLNLFWIRLVVGYAITPGAYLIEQGYGRTYFCAALKLFICVNPIVCVSLLI